MLDERYGQNRVRASALSARAFAARRSSVTAPASVGNVAGLRAILEDYTAFADVSAKPIRILTKISDERSPRDLRAIGLLRRTLIDALKHIGKLSR
jgi:hypothetical protein